MEPTPPNAWATILVGFRDDDARENPTVSPNSVILSEAKDLPRQRVFIDFAGCSFCFYSPLTPVFFRMTACFNVVLRREEP